MSSTADKKATREQVKFLAEVAFALAYDESEEDLGAEEYARFNGAKDDVERGQLTERVIAEAHRYLMEVRPDWICEKRSVYARWCRVLAAHGALERELPGTAHYGRRPSFITVNGVRYYAP